MKTAGTSWLEELIGLALAGGEGLEIAKEIYVKAYNRYEELCRPYATVIDIERQRLPLPEKVMNWKSEDFANALRHDLLCEDYNPNFRQLLHVGYKIAAEMGMRYTEALKTYEDIIAQNVTQNIYERHIKGLFM